ncbi:MAG: hypothetical protein AWU54_1871 [Candidatus Frackibacter sp. T328-2]|nr:MAG: hypothetical protein AWU54_1871 [Candidatus Frackibacter sp. T328-2]
MGCDVEKPEVGCTCTYEACPRRENCCQCVVHHRERGEIPACFFPSEVEKTYDRSRERFIEAFS